MTDSPIDVALDANALDEPDPETKKLVDRFKSLAADGRIRVIVGEGVRSELQHPRTPGRSGKSSGRRRPAGDRP